MTIGTVTPPRTSLPSSHVESLGRRRRPRRGLRWRTHFANTNTDTNANVNSDASPDHANCGADTIPDAPSWLLPDQRWDQ